MFKSPHNITVTQTHIVGRSIRIRGPEQVVHLTGVQANTQEVVRNLQVRQLCYLLRGRPKGSDLAGPLGLYVGHRIWVRYWRTEQCDPRPGGPWDQIHLPGTRTSGAPGPHRVHLEALSCSPLAAGSVCKNVYAWLMASGGPTRNPSSKY